MKGLKYLLTVIFLLLVLAALVISPLRAAQVTATPFTVISPTPSSQSNPNVIITSPPIVSELHGPVDVQGTANLPNMDNYFLEVRVLNDDASIPSDDVPWLPATLPSSSPVQNGVLATWDTSTVADGLYELRLTATAENMPSVSYLVTPLRVNNAPFATPLPVVVQPTATEIVPDTTPRVTAVLTANVRTGDSVLYPVIGFLVHGDSAEVLGISSTGSGWYFIRLANGVTGWVAPFVVATSGDFSTVPALTPPPLPVTPTLTPVPIAPDLELNGIALSPTPPVCGSSFNVVLNVSNVGNGSSLATNVFVQDVHVASGTGTASGMAFVPPLDAGANYTVNIALIVTTYYGETHQIRANLGGSQITTSYILAQGQCNVPPTLVPAASQTPVPPTVTPIPVVPDLQLNGISLTPSLPVCGMSFNVVLNIANVGNGPSGSTNVFVQDVQPASGTVTANGAGFLPPLGAGAHYTISIPLIVTTYYNEVHQIQARLGSSQVTTSYTLAQGQCNNAPQVAPVVTFTPRPPTRTPGPPTPTRVPPTTTSTFTRTPVPPTQISVLPTHVPPTATPTFTRTPIPPSPTPRSTATPTLTRTLVPPTLTRVLPTATPTLTRTLVPPTLTRVPPTATLTRTPIPTFTSTPTPTGTQTVSAPPEATGTEPGIDLVTLPYNNVTDPAVQARIRQIYDSGKKQGAVPGNFRVVGDKTLAGISGVNDPQAAFDKYETRYRPVIQFFSTGFKAVSAPTVGADFTSADILNPAKGSGPCQRNSPLNCALASRPSIVLIDVGRNDIKANIRLDQFGANLEKAVNMVVQRGAIPVLVTIVGTSKPADQPRLAQYNLVIYNAANAAHIPLFNAYRIGAEDPTRINPATGELSASPARRTDLSPSGLQFGVNVAPQYTLELLLALRDAVPLS